MSKLFPKWDSKVDGNENKLFLVQKKLIITKLKSFKKYTI